MKKIKTGILGGSFDPPHIAHIELAKAAIKAGLEEIIFMPAYQAALKDAPVSASAEDRIKMLSLATAVLDFPCEISDYEISKGGMSYSIDTAKHLIKENPNREFYWIIGTDHLSKLKYWKDISSLAKIVKFLCAQRGGYSSDTKEVPEGVEIKFIDFDEIELSSTQIREAIKKSGTSNLRLDPKVVEYILEQKLYK